MTAAMSSDCSSSGPWSAKRRLHHALGAFLGGAVGDALGAPFEFGPAGRYSAEFPTAVLAGVGEMRGGGPWAPGEFTDDTQMAVSLAESLLTQGRLDEIDVWKRWKAWAASAKDVGILTRTALRCSGPEDAAEYAHEANGGRSAGNGTIMRNPPVVLFSMHWPLAEAVELSCRQAALTHYDLATHQGAAIHAVMLRAGIDGTDMFAALDAWLTGLPPSERTEWMTLLGPRWAPEHACLPNGTVWTCLAQAVWCVRQADTFAEAVVRAVELGGDTDTVACVTGSLAGARWGIQAIPSRWTTYLHGMVDTPDGLRSYDNAALEDLGRRLAGHAALPLIENEAACAPVRVHDDVPVHAANWLGACDAPEDWAVVSLCRTGGRFTDYPVRREVHLIDQYSTDDNPSLDDVLRNAVDTIDALLAEEPQRPVLVHCHGGRSRTALVLKAWAMRRHGWDEVTAHEWLTERWPRADRTNPVFVDLLRRGGLDASLAQGTRRQ